MSNTAVMQCVDNLSKLVYVVYSGLYMLSKRSEGQKRRFANMNKEDRSAMASHAISSFWKGKSKKERSAIMKARRAKGIKNGNKS